MMLKLLRDVFFCLTSRKSSTKLSVKLAKHCKTLLLPENIQFVKHNTLVQDKVRTNSVSRFIRFIIHWFEQEFMTKLDGATPISAAKC